MTELMLRLRRNLIATSCLAAGAFAPLAAHAADPTAAAPAR